MKLSEYLKLNFKSLFPLWEEGDYDGEVHIIPTHVVAAADAVVEAAHAYMTRQDEKDGAALWHQYQVARAAYKEVHD